KTRHHAKSTAKGCSAWVIEKEPVLAQVDFIYKKDSYTFRISLGQDDISGMYMDFSNTKEFFARHLL
ncbi:MAG: hypothetical protein RSD64_04195, partial [Christensenellaceae bacterium]